jgi:hypothetical protein
MGTMWVVGIGSILRQVLEVPLHQDEAAGGKTSAPALRGWPLAKRQVPARPDGLAAGRAFAFPVVRVAKQRGRKTGPSLVNPAR